MLPTQNMQTKTALIMSLIAASMVIALATILATPALAEPKEKTTTKGPSYILADLYGWLESHSGFTHISASMLSSSTNTTIK
jgi:hypothetical protein